MLNYSTSMENYIKSIYRLQRKEGTVSTNELAQELKTKPASVTDMLKKLKIKKLIHYRRYKGFRLTHEGSKLALDIIRRHRLWEYFLSVKLKFPWNEVHTVAEELEHISNKKLIEKLDEYLGYPRIDPHGDPIPDVSGNLVQRPLIPLSELPIKTMATVSHIKNQSSAILELLDHRRIHIGTRLQIKKKFEFDNSLEIKISRQPIFTITKELAENIYVQTY